MSDDYASSTTVVLHGIEAISQLGIAVATAFVALVGYIAFIREDAAKREDRARRENRKLVADLISALEIYATKVWQTNAVGFKTVDYFVEELATVEASIGRARGHGLNILVDAANECVKEVKTLRNAIVLAKRKRPVPFPKGGKRPNDYQEAMTRASQCYQKVNDARARVFEQASNILGIQISRSTSDDPQSSLVEEE